MSESLIRTVEVDSVGSAAVTSASPLFLSFAGLPSHGYLIHGAELSYNRSVGGTAHLTLSITAGATTLITHKLRVPGVDVEPHKMWIGPPPGCALRTAIGSALVCLGVVDANTIQNCTLKLYYSKWRK